MNCPECRRPMTIVGSHRVCGAHQTPVFLPYEPEQHSPARLDWLDGLVEELPFPLAMTCRRLRDDVAAHTADYDALRQLIRLKDCVETLVRYLAILAFSARLDRSEPTDALDRRILQKLVAPSLGSWAQEILQPLVRDPGTHEDSRLTPLVQFADSRFFGRIGEFTALRNSVLGHGLVRDPREDRRDVNQWLPQLQALLEGARFLVEWELIQAGEPLRSWMGDVAEASVQPAKCDPARFAGIASRPREFLVVPVAGRPFSVFPFIHLLICPRCAESERLFVYDSQKRFTTDRRQTSMLEHTAGHKCAFEEPARGLAEKFDEQLLLEHYRQYRRNFEVLEGKITEFDFDTYRSRVPFFVGRRPVLEAISGFMAGRPVGIPDGPAGPFDRGCFLLVAEAGIGKTALLTHWIDCNDTCGEPIRFFWRRGRHLTTFDFLRHVYHGLLTRHGIVDEDPPQEKHDYRRKLDSLLQVISDRYLAEGEREVIVVDGLDEAGDSAGRQAALAAIPRELPANIYFLLSSRPVRELDSLGGHRDQILRYTIAPGADWNRADVREYAEQMLGTLLATRELAANLLPRIEDAADGNFLWAEQFCRSVLRGDLPPDAVADSLPRMQGLEELYREFWSRVIHSLSPEAEQRQWRVAGVLSVARTALTSEQICRFTGLDDDEWILCRAQLQQYLDEVQVPDEQNPETPLVAFRIYHASFRDYLLGQPGLVPAQHHARIVRACLTADGTGPNDETVDYSAWDRYGLAFVPHHAIQAGLWNELESLLTDLPFLEAKTAAGMVFDLAADFRETVAALPPEREQRRILELLEEALRRDLHFIHRHFETCPQILFQCLWNTCWWYDCPQAGQHYLPPPGGWGPEGAPWQQPGPKLSSLVETWRSEREQREPGFHWVRSCRPPQIMAGTGQSSVVIQGIGKIHGVSLSRDGSLLAAGTISGMPPWIRVQNVETGETLCRIEPDDGRMGALGVSPRALVLSPTGRYLASGYSRGTVRVYEVASTPRVVVEMPLPGEVVSLAFDAPEHELWCLCDDGSFHVLELATGHQIRSSRLCDHRLRDAAIAVGANRVLLLGTGHQVTLVSTDPPGVVRAWDIPDDEPTAVALSADGTRAAAGLSDGRIQLFHEDRRPVLTGHTGKVSDLAFDACTACLVSVARDGTLRLWDTRDGREVACVAAHDEYIRVVATSAAGTLATASEDGTVKLWEANRLASGPVLRNHVREDFPGQATADLAADGWLVASGGSDGTIRLWNAVTGIQLANETGEGWVTSVTFSPDGSRLAAGGTHPGVSVFDVAAMAEGTGASGKVAELATGETGVEGLAWNPAGTVLAAVDRRGHLHLWDFDCDGNFAGQQQFPIDPNASCLAWRSDGGAIVIATRQGTVGLWDAHSGAAVSCLRSAGPPGSRAIEWIGFLPGDDEVVWNGAGSEVVRYNVLTGEETALRASGIMRATPVGPFYQWMPERLAYGLNDDIRFENSDGAKLFYPLQVRELRSVPPGRQWVALPFSGTHLPMLQIEPQPSE